MSDSLGVYVSVPFCKAKCTYCNFASGVFGAERVDAYVERLCAEMRGALRWAERIGATLPAEVDTVYLGGGTPSLLSAEQMRRLFSAVRAEFQVSSDAEITLECAPGQLSDETLQEMLRQGMNRVSFGVQSFVDAEAKAVGRSHTREVCLREIARMRAAGVGNINVDLIVGLPGQTAESWRESVSVALDTGAPHVSVYMLEVDEDSRLGREMLRAGDREQATGNREQGAGYRLKYGADAVATEDEVAEWYGSACEWLEAGGVRQYEISNFAREGYDSRHNIKYWRREPYVGFGLDAHSMLRCGVGGVRWANSWSSKRISRTGNTGLATGNNESLECAGMPEVGRVGREQAFEEAMFLGLRMNEGVALEALREEFGAELVGGAVAVMADVEEAGLVVVEGARDAADGEGADGFE